MPTQNNIVPEGLKSRLKESYDAIAEHYTAWATRTADIRIDHLNQLLALLPSTHKDILELGSGAGIPTIEKMLGHDARFRIVANDLSPTQIALGKARLQSIYRNVDEDEMDRVRWVEGDMMELVFPDASFDVVLGFYTVQHLPREEQTALLGRVVEWLRPGGFVLMNFPVEETPGEVMEGWMGDKGWVYLSGWGAKKYRALMMEFGMEVLLDEVKMDNVRAEFLWIVARKPKM